MLIILLGAAQLLIAWRQPPESTGSWPLRDMVPVLIGIFLFALTIRGFDFGAFRIPVLGMAVATPLLSSAPAWPPRMLARWSSDLANRAVRHLCRAFPLCAGLSLPVAPC